MQFWDQHRYILIKFLIFLKLYIFLAWVNIKLLKKGENIGSERTSVIYIGEAFLVPTFRYLPSSVGRWHSLLFFGMPSPARSFISYTSLECS